MQKGERKRFSFISYDPISPSERPKAVYDVEITVLRQLAKECPILDEFYQASQDVYFEKLRTNLEKNGATVEDYCRDLGIDEHELNLEMILKSGEMLRQGFALETYFDEMGFELDDDDIENTLRAGFPAYRGFSRSRLAERGMLFLVETAAKRHKALHYLVDTAHIKEKPS